MVKSRRSASERGSEKTTVSGRRASEYGPSERKVATSTLTAGPPVSPPTSSAYIWTRTTPNAAPTSWVRLKSDKDASRKRLFTFRRDPRDLSVAWFFDPELLIKAHYLGVRVLELNAFARMRGRGESNVRATTCWEFLRELLRYRFTAHLGPWKRAVRAADGKAAALPR